MKQVLTLHMSARRDAVAVYVWG